MVKTGRWKDCWTSSETWCSACSGDWALREQLERDFLGVSGVCFTFWSRASVEEARELREKVGQDAGDTGLW